MPGCLDAPTRLLRRPASAAAAAAAAAAATYSPAPRTSPSPLRRRHRGAEVHPPLPLRRRRHPGATRRRRHHRRRLRPGRGRSGQCTQPGHSLRRRHLTQLPSPPSASEPPPPRHELLLHCPLEPRTPRRHPPSPPAAQRRHPAPSRAPPQQAVSTAPGFARAAVDTRAIALVATSWLAHCARSCAWL